MATSEPAPPAESSAPRRFFVRRAIILGILALLIAIPWLLREYRISQIPLIPEPFDVEAFFRECDVPDERNAFVEYKLASEKFQEIPDWQKLADFTDPLGTPWDHYPPLAREYLEKNEPTFQLWLAGTHKPDALYVHPRDLNIETLLPVIQNLRGITRLVVWKAVQLQDTGKLDEAWEYLGGIIRTTNHVSQNGCIIERLVGCALNGTINPSIHRWAEDPQVTPAQLRTALDEVRSLTASLPPPARSFKSEYDQFRDPQKNFPNLNLLNGAVPPLPTAPLADRFSYWLSGSGMNLFYRISGEYELARRLHRHVLANWIAHEQIPYALLRDSTVPGSPVVLFNTQPSTDSSLPPARIAEIAKASHLYPRLVPAVNQLMEAAARDLSRRRELEVMLALQLYFHDHQQFPAELKSLVPDYLPSLPANPARKDGGTFLYQVEPDHVVLWTQGTYAPVPLKDGPQFGFNTPQGFTIFWTIYPPGTRPPLYRPIQPSKSLLEQVREIAPAP